VVGRAGVVAVLPPDLSAEERAGLEQSAQNLRTALRSVGG
jgi:malate/lactate dehydrogenase